MSTELTTTRTTAIASSEDNMREIVNGTPQFFSKNRSSHDNCLRAGSDLLAKIKAAGMTDDLDLAAAKYLEKTRRTVAAMKELRAPATRLFDQVKKEFTMLENDIDVSKLETVPFQLQQLRNQYAAKKYEEAEKLRLAAEAKRQAKLARDKFAEECTEDYKTKFNQLIIENINELTKLNESVNLDNYEEIYSKVEKFPTLLSCDWNPLSSVRMPLNLLPSDARKIGNEVLNSLRPSFEEQYHTEIGDYRQEILDILPSKKLELERAANASVEEAAKIQKELREREAAEAARKEAERREREREAARQEEVKKVNSEAANLFDAVQGSVPAYTPKAKVTKKIRITGYEGYVEVMSLWWAKEGCRLPKDELDKIFKKQIAFCEKLANKEEQFISDDHGVEYYDEVKAK